MNKEEMKEIEKKLLSLRKEIARAAQRVYDEWEQDETGCDPELGEGGICDQIADEIATILSNHGFEVGEWGQDGDDHAAVTVPTGENHGFVVDIPWNLYEKKNAYYSYSKIPGVVFSPDDVDVDPY